MTHKFLHFWLDIDSANIQTYCVLSINDCILNLIPTAQTSKHWRCPYFFAVVFGFVNLSSHSIWFCSSSDVVQGLVFIELTPRCPCPEPRLFHFGYVKFSIFIYSVKFAWQIGFLIILLLLTRCSFVRHWLNSFGVWTVLSHLQAS